jgi:hypothetical protein
MTKGGYGIHASVLGMKAAVFHWQFRDLGTNFLPRYTRGIKNQCDKLRFYDFGILKKTVKIINKIKDFLPA